MSITYTQGWDVENRLVAVTTPTGTVQFRYDGDGNRVLRIGPEGITVYIGDYYERQGSVVTKYYYAAGQRIAVRVGGALYFLHGDHLGSATLTTDINGNRVGELRYTPYGVTRHEWGNTPTNRRYTGQRWDTALGLYDYRARYYHPALGRFISADPLVLEPGNPQALNRYAYVYNNPLRYTDPTGHFAWLVAVPVGALIGAGVTYGIQVAANISQNGLNVQAFTAVNWAAVGGGAVAGAVGAATFGVGTAVLGTGLAGTVAAGAISGAVAGQAARATENVLQGKALTTGLGEPGEILQDMALGGAFAGAAYGAGRIFRAASSSRITNPIPRRMARVIPADLADSVVTLGPPGAEDVFVTAADDIAGIKTTRDLAYRLTLVDEAGNLRKGPFAVLEFDTPEYGIASPINRRIPGFVGRGRTAGGAREFVIPNFPISNLKNLRIWRVE
ncbi:polymorphic toxin type 10 domain-containing protein [Thermoflexus hugenholtzii]